DQGLVEAPTGEAVDFVAEAAVGEHHGAVLGVDAVGHNGGVGQPGRPEVVQVTLAQALCYNVLVGYDRRHRLVSFLGPSAGDFGECPRAGFSSPRYEFLRVRLWLSWRANLLTVRGLALRPA